MIDYILSFFECRFSGGDTMRWWGHSNPTICKKNCLNFLHSQVAEMQKFPYCALCALHTFYVQSWWGC